MWDQDSQYGQILTIDYTAEAGDYTASETDDVALGESTAITPLVLPNLVETDDVAVGETTAALLESQVLESDGVTVGDDITVTPMVLPNLTEADDLAIGETIGADLSIGVGIEMDGAAYQGTGVRVR